ncbi:LysE family translocator [Actinoalloteichus hymeniacidonis]|uniref:Threonine efflux protein n=1 Tax=Actinoalloteichus hymeniacidonis TaxID=340345 RepID=A0AAC9HQQ9_9PSEU|nr:LysE family transporter [Actinoalloteichus hymeniacidonis]AOS62810.1 putative threonine efflux protein [Actinoalloteichus hymeniacidonis]MBB5909159.1 putative LysE/RhtB family amino acid efflux pump [Actinoalloteichus hymeniacidonis]
MVTALASGFGFGLLVAAQVGPIWLLCVRSVLRGGVTVGLALGLGAALVDVAYAALGIAGVATALQIWGVRMAAGALGVAILLVLGVRALTSALRTTPGDVETGDVLAVRRAFLTGLGATASNPLTILSWAAVFAAVSAAGGETGDSSMLLIGVGVGTFCWFGLLSVLVAGLGRFIGPSVRRTIDLVAAVGLLVLAVLLAWQVFL